MFRPLNPIAKSNEVRARICRSQESLSASTGVEIITFHLHGTKTATLPCIVADDSLLILRKMARIVDKLARHLLMAV